MDIVGTINSTDQDGISCCAAAIDLFDRSADLRLDLREPWPFPDNSVSHIYSEHVFEHFDFLDEVPHFLSESLRVLCEGVVFDVGVPDSDWPLRAWGNPNDGYWCLARSLHPQYCETNLDFVNYHFRRDKLHGGHKYARVTSFVGTSGWTSYAP
jgi:Methyltransferase domain